MSLQNDFLNHQTDYSVKRQDIIPSYKFTKLYQQTGGQIVTIDTSTPDSYFELPPRVFNLSKSILKFTATPVAGGANTANWMFQECIAGIRQISLQTRGGVVLCDINNLDKYSKLVLKTDVKKPDSNEMDLPGNTNNLRYGVVAGALASFKYDQTGADANPSVYRPVYAIPSTAANAADPVLNIELPLSQIKNTIFALDKDLFFNEVLLIHIIWNPYTSWGFKSVQAAGACLTDPLTGQTALAGNISISNLAFDLALEDNLAISAGIISSVQTQGMDLVVPYVWPFKFTPTAATTSQNVSIRINGNYGRHLKKIYHSLFNTAEASGTRYLNTNANQTNIASYYTMVDNERRQQFDVKTSDNDDYDYIKKNLHGSLIANCDIYRYNWFVFERFDEGQDTMVDCVDSGLPLNIEHKWDFVGTTSNAVYNHYTFAVCSRIVSITPLGVSIHN